MNIMCVSSAKDLWRSERSSDLSWVLSKSSTCSSALSHLLSPHSDSSFLLRQPAGPAACLTSCLHCSLSGDLILEIISVNGCMIIPMKNILSSERTFGNILPENNRYKTYSY